MPAPYRFRPATRPKDVRLLNLDAPGLPREYRALTDRGAGAVVPLHIFDVPPQCGTTSPLSTAKRKGVESRVRSSGGLPTGLRLMGFAWLLSDAP